MILLDTLLGNFTFHVIELVVIAALMVLAIVLGAKLRKATDQLKEKKKAQQDQAVKDTPEE